MIERRKGRVEDRGYRGSYLKRNLLYVIIVTLDIESRDPLAHTKTSISQAAS